VIALPATDPITELTFGPCDEDDLPLIQGTGLAWVPEEDGLHHLILLRGTSETPPANTVDFLVQGDGRLSVSLTRAINI
jgi:hypothetical protein